MPALTFSMSTRVSTALAALGVLAAWFYFATGRSFRFESIPPANAIVEPANDRFGPYYPALAEGFLHGRLDMPYEADPRWKDVVNAYDQKARAPHGLEWEMWDASYYNGRFYLYFSPLPVLLFYIPIRLLTGAYPVDAQVAFLASAWALFACVAFARRALAGRPFAVPCAIWVLLIGLGNGLPFLLRDVRAYEVAVVTGMAMTASWAYFLLHWTESGATRHAVWMSVWLALAIAARPNLVVLVAVTAFVVFRHRRAALAAVVPLAVVAIGLMTYNYLRFADPFELGMTYQISYEPIWRHAPCSLCDVPELLRFLNNLQHYVFWPPRFVSEFPFVSLQNNALDPAVSYAGGAEPIGGAGSMNPLVLVGSAVGLLFALVRGEGSPGLRAAIRVLAGAWLVLLALSTCRWVTARYALDFMLLLITASAVCIEHGLARLANADVRVWPLRLLTMALAVFSIAVGVLLGFAAR
jgi:hypothetical protein